MLRYNAWWAVYNARSDLDATHPEPIIISFEHSGGNYCTCWPARSLKALRHNRSLSSMWREQDKARVATRIVGGYVCMPAGVPSGALPYRRERRGRRMAKERIAVKEGEGKKKICNMWKTPNNYKARVSQRDEKRRGGEGGRVGTFALLKNGSKSTR